MRPDAPGALRSTVDQLACADHNAIPATATHQVVGSQVWRAFRALGFREGLVLAAGDGAATLLGLPGLEHAPSQTVVADLDHRHRPRMGLLPHLSVGDNTAGFDVVIMSLPSYDVRLTYGPNINARRAAQLTATLTALNLTRPGGLTALLATHDLMDNPVPDGRRRIAQMTDLIGALRLPAGMHRRSPGTEEVTDLLLLRRRPVGERRRGPDFQSAPAVFLDGAIVTLNTYFDTSIDQVLGTTEYDPTGTPLMNLTVTGDPEHFVTVLTDRIDHIIETGKRLGLRMAPRTVNAGATVDPSDIRRHHPKARRLRRHLVPDVADLGPARPREDLAGPGHELP